MPSHFQVVKDHSNVPIELAHFLSDTAHPFAFDEAHGESSQACHILRTMACADTAAVFIVIPVDDVMTAVLDVPVPAVILQHLGGAGLVGCFTGNPIGDLLPLLAAFLWIVIRCTLKACPTWGKFR